VPLIWSLLRWILAILLFGFGNFAWRARLNSFLALRAFLVPLFAFIGIAIWASRKPEAAASPKNGAGARIGDLIFAPADDRMNA